MKTQNSMKNTAEETFRDTEKKCRKKDLFQTNQSSNIRRDSFSNARDSKLGMKGNLNALKNGFWAGADSSILRPRITKVI